MYKPNKLLPDQKPSVSGFCVMYCQPCRLVWLQNACSKKKIISGFNKTTELKFHLKRQNFHPLGKKSCLKVSFQSINNSFCLCLRDQYNLIPFILLKVKELQIKARKSCKANFKKVWIWSTAVLGYKSGGGKILKPSWLILYFKLKI